MFEIIDHIIEKMVEEMNILDLLPDEDVAERDPSTRKLVISQL